jgi:hypothetical protein
MPVAGVLNDPMVKQVLPGFNDIRFVPNVGVGIYDVYREIGIKFYVFIFHGLL